MLFYSVSNVALLLVAKRAKFHVITERRNVSSDAPVSKAEIWLILYGLGLTLDKIASILEHGWTGTFHHVTTMLVFTYILVFTANMWNGLDFCFCFSFIVYFSLVVSGKGEEGHAILACGAVLLFPRYLVAFIFSESFANLTTIDRLAFVTLSNNVLVL